MLGLIDGDSVKLESTMDGMPVDVHLGLVALLAETVRRGLRRAAR